MMPQVGQGIFTEATGLGVLRPAPSQRRVTPTVLPQAQQAKSRESCSANKARILHGNEGIRPLHPRRTHAWARPGPESRLRPGLLAFALRPVLRSCLLAVGDSLRVEHAADDVIADTGQVADTAAAHEHD